MENIEELTEAEKALAETLNKIISELLMQKPEIFESKIVNREELYDFIDPMLKVFEEKFKGRIKEELEKRLFREFGVRISSLDDYIDSFPRFNRLKKQRRFLSFEDFLETNFDFLSTLAEDISENFHISREKALKILFDKLENNGKKI
jgi:hypothetical protein